MPQDHIEIYLALRQQQDANEALFWLLLFGVALCAYFGLAGWLMERYWHFIEHQVPGRWHRSLEWRLPIPKGVREWWAECAKRWADEEALEYDRLGFVYDWRYLKCFEARQRIALPVILALSFPVVRLKLLAWCAKFAICCSPIGHRLESDDWAGPESGGMGAHCEHCGWSFHHILY